MTRNGKIARLPLSIRSQLNEKLRDGEQGVTLVEWLNQQPRVQEILARDFGGKAITEQNLSEWKKGGYEEWVEHQKDRDWVDKVTMEAWGLQEETGGAPVSDQLGPMMAVAIGRCVQAIASAAVDDPEKLKSLIALSQELGRLRRGDHSEMELRMARERWEAEKDEAEKDAQSAFTMSPFLNLTITRTLGELLKSDLKESKGELPPPWRMFVAEMEARTRKPPGPPPNSPPADPSESK